MDLVEDMDDLIDRHYANLQDYQRVNPLEDIGSDMLFQSWYRFNKCNFERLTEELTPLFDVRRSAEVCSAEQIVDSALEIMAGALVLGHHKKYIDIYYITLIGYPSNFD